MSETKPLQLFRTHKKQDQAVFLAEEPNSLNVAFIDNPKDPSLTITLDGGDCIYTATIPESRIKEIIFFYTSCKKDRT